MSESQPNQELITFNIQDELKRSDDEKDLIMINLSSHSIKIHYYQLCKYSQLIEDEYQKIDVGDRLSYDIERIQKDFNIEDNNVITFINIMKEGNIQLSSYQFRDLFILAEYFKVKFLQSFLERYSKSHLKDINYVINTILSFKSNRTNECIQNDELSIRMEQILIDKIDKCIQNENFGKLPISIVYRIFEKSDMTKISNDDLYTFITRSIESRHILFYFLDIQNLSDDNFNDLYNSYLKQKKSKTVFYYQFLHVDLDYVKQLKDEIKNGDIIQNKKLTKNIEILNTKIDQLKNENFELKEENQKLSHDINELNTEIKELKIQNNEFVEKYENIPPLIKAQIEKYHQMKLIKKEVNHKMDIQVIKAIVEGFENKIKKTESKKNLLYLACEAGIPEVVQYILTHNNFDINEKCFFEILFHLFHKINFCDFNERNNILNEILNHKI